MNYNKFFSFRTLSIAVICTGLAITGCHVDDRTPQPAASDTATVSPSDAEMAAHDTGTMKPGTTTMKQGTGVAKANPAKKGMKGKVTILESPKTAATADIEVYPSFPGGSKGLQEYFDKNLTYPAEATNDGVEGTVNVMFTVDETGKLSDAHVMGDKQGYGLDDEALRVVKTMPAWNPGKLKGKNVKTSFTLPVSFQLQ